MTLSIHPQISVVITCYREGILLQEAVNSVRKQTYPHREIVIVNDASPDPITNDLCRQLDTETDIRVVWQSQNGGPSVARNAGFAAAQSEILVPLDADDLLPITALDDIQKAFAQHPEAGFVYGSYIRQDHPSKEKIIHAKPISLSTLLRSRRFSLSTNWTLLGTAPLRKTLWQAIGYSDPTLGAEDLHDLEFWIRAMALPSQFYRIPKVIYIWRKYLGSNSRQVNPMAWYRIAEKHYTVYEQVGLAYRANELLLLGSKWAGDRTKVSQYSHALWRCIRHGQFQLSSWIIWLIPAAFLRFLVRWRQRYR